MASKQIAIKEVLNFTVFNFSTGAPLFRVDYAGNTSIEMAAERLDLRGGQGNYKLVSFDHTKDAMMKCELPLVDLEFIALLTGKALDTTTKNVPQYEVLTADGSNQITLTATPATGTLKVYTKTGDRDFGVEQTVGTPATTENEYSISGAVVTLNATTGAEGNEFIVTYDYSSAVARTMTFTADEFPGYFRITGDGVVTDQVEGDTYVTKFDVLKCKPQNNFTITMQSTDATKLDITFDLYAVNETQDDGSIDKVYLKMHELTA